jgi:chemotaxis protein methyltransferase WspC
MKDIEARLAREIGLDVEALGRPALERVVRGQMQRAGTAQFEDYAKLLRSSVAEWEALVESTVVTETWFFRDLDAFAGLTRFVLDRWLPQKRPTPLRLLSLPCASGEEPYSMAMTLLEAGLSPSRFQIDGVDLSVRVLLRAQQGSYGRNAFRTKDLGFRNRYFHAVEERFVLRKSVRDLVRFQQANVLATDWAAKGQVYDCIFCRNLLIYLDEPGQDRTLAHMRSVLRPGGVLFVGPAEQIAALNSGFVSAQMPMGFEYRAKEPTRAIHVVPEGPRVTPWPASGTGLQHREKVSLAEVPRESHTEASPPHAAEVLGSLQQARRLADTGHLREAEVLCETHLRAHPDCAEAYYLLGLVRDAAGRSEALDYYRKALYLEPRHQETLLQMALWAERSGDSSAAANLRRRAERAKTERSHP